MQKLVSAFAYLVVALAFFSVYGWVVKHYAKDNALDKFVSFLDVFETAVDEVQTLPKTFVPTPSDFKQVNKLENDVFGLVSYTNEENDRTVKILNLKDGSTKWSWDIANPHNAHNRIMNPITLSNKRLAYGYIGAPGIICVDSLGVELWRQNKAHNHHSLNLDHEGNVWVCDYADNSYELKHGARYTLVSSDDSQAHETEVSFIDNFITLLSEKNGEVIFKKSVAEIFKENDLQYLLLKSPNLEDPIHLNDIQPVLIDGEYWKQGDVFLSFRNNSAVILYRPESGKVLKVLEGPFHSQHDVDILNDSTVAIFNNNRQTLFVKGTNGKLRSEVVELGRLASNIVHYNFQNSSFSVKENEVFNKNNIATFTEGLFDYLSDGSVFIEEQNSSVLWIIDDGEVVYKNVLKSHHDGHHHLLNWTRILD